MNLIQWIEIFAMVTGVAYVVLEILQKNAMWVVGVLTGGACAFSFGVQHSWGMMGLNIYYVVISFVGLVRWRRDGASLEEGDIHLKELPLKTALWSAGFFVVLSVGFAALLRALGDGASTLDAVASVLSVIATWWLSESYLQQWLLWIVADVMTTALCIITGQYALALLYFAYIVSAVYGYYHWKKKGIVVNLHDGI